MRDVIRSYGHLNKLQWRSKAKSILQKSLELMLLETNPAIEECIVTVRHLIVSINVYTAQHIIMTLQEIKMKYINNLDDYNVNNVGDDVVVGDNNNNDGDNNNQNQNQNNNNKNTLGYHCQKVREIDEILIKKPVPLLREEWSDNLLQTIQTKNILQSTSISHQFSTQQLLPPPPESSSSSISSPIFTHNNHIHNNSNSQQKQSFSPLRSSSSSPQNLNQSFYSNSMSLNSEVDLNDLQIGYSSEFHNDSFHQNHFNSSSSSTYSTTSNSTSNSQQSEPTITTLPIRYPPSEKIINHTTSIQYLRQLSKDGLFQEAWGVFNSLYGEYIVYNQPTNPIYKYNLKSPPTLETIKLLFISLKNSSLKYFSNNDISNLLQLLKRLNITPDIVLYNIILCTCEKYGSWRRALFYIKHMQNVYNILPNTHTYEILINCCRHTVSDTPASIFETLRNEGLPRK